MIYNRHSTLTNRSVRHWSTCLSHALACSHCWAASSNGTWNCWRLNSFFFSYRFNILGSGITDHRHLIVHILVFIVFYFTDRMCKGHRSFVVVVFTMLWIFWRLNEIWCQNFVKLNEIKQYELTCFYVWFNFQTVHLKIENKKRKQIIFGIIVIFGDIGLLNFFITMHLSVNDERTRFQLPARLQATFFCDSSLYVRCGC